jgi:hypothetical protein
MNLKSTHAHRHVPVITTVSIEDLAPRVVVSVVPNSASWKGRWSGDFAANFTIELAANADQILTFCVQGTGNGRQL